MITSFRTARFIRPNIFRALASSSVQPPSDFIERIDRKGNVIPGEIDPSELLVSSYQSNNPKDLFFEFFASGICNRTKDEDWGRVVLRLAKKMGAFKKKEKFFRFKPFPYSEEFSNTVVHELKVEASKKLENLKKDGKYSFRIFITGGTGFIGMDFLEAVAKDDQVKEVLCLVYNKEMAGISEAEYKKKVMARLDIPESFHSKYKFVPGDVTQVNFGLSEEVMSHLKSSTTHMVHLAASVSFQDPYDKMFKANVLATQHALNFALSLQNAPNSPFVNFISTETCFIHGRQVPPRICKEEEVVFPRDYYNNFYEPTKALAAIEAKKFMLEKRLRCLALCPAITIGKSKNGNNRGDTKVINAAVNTLGRIHDMIRRLFPVPFLWPFLARTVTFPCSSTAVMDLVPLDRVTDALVASIRKPLATGERIHLTCGGVSIDGIREAWFAEMAMYISNPVTHRKIIRPLLEMFLRLLGQPKFADTTERLFQIFCVYSEWGQPIHDMGNDVRLLGMSPNRPDLVPVLRLMLRHNQFVQDFGRIRDPIEITKREKVWAEFVEKLENRTGVPVATMSAKHWKVEQQALKDLLPGLLLTNWSK